MTAELFGLNGQAVIFYRSSFSLQPLLSIAALRGDLL
jgi:hypothetical protein